MTTKKKPTKPKKIAIIGTAPQWQLAPFEDQSWDIWGIYGVACCGRRLTRLYELHEKSVIIDMAEKMYPNGEYFKVANDLGKNYITRDAYDQCPDAVRFDFEAKIKKFGPYFASSASWLIADAIDQGADEIGIWGVNMSSDGEYVHQKPSCSFLLGYARALGIKITIPPTSELLALTHQYGYEDEPRFLQGLIQKRNEIEAQMAAHKNNLDVSKMGVYGAEQALSIVKWMEQNFGTGGKNAE